MQKYAGAVDDKADGFAPAYYETGKRNYKGDNGEAEFVDLMRNEKIGGISVGDISSKHIYYTEKNFSTVKKNISCSRVQ